MKLHGPGGGVQRSSLLLYLELILAASCPTQPKLSKCIIFKGRQHSGFHIVSLYSHSLKCLSEDFCVEVQQRGTVHSPFLKIFQNDQINNDSDQHFTV